MSAEKKSPAERYWSEMDQIKVHLFYLELYLTSTIFIERGLNIAIAIASSTSIGAWAIWGKYPMVWACFLALSHIVTAAKPWLPFSKRLHALYRTSVDLEGIFILMETDWYYISEGALGDEDIHKKNMHYRQQKERVIQKYLASNPLPEKPKLLEQAIEKTKLYFTNHY